MCICPLCIVFKKLVSSHYHILAFIKSSMMACFDNASCLNSNQPTPSTRVCCVIYWNYSVLLFSLIVWSKILRRNVDALDTAVNRLTRFPWFDLLWWFSNIVNCSHCSSSAWLCPGCWSRRRRWWNPGLTAWDGQVVYQ